MHFTWLIDSEESISEKTGAFADVGIGKVIEKVKRNRQYYVYRSLSLNQLWSYYKHYKR